MECNDLIPTAYHPGTLLSAKHLYSCWDSNVSKILAKADNVDIG